MQLRDYQQECIASIPESGRYLIQMATGLGKTVTFANIPRRGRTLILSHRDELVHQPLKYFDCPAGVEMAAERSRGEDVVSASVQTLVHRLGRFAPDAFDIIIVDEAHHSAARSYRKVLAYFTPRLLLGFTATPNRSDNVRLDDIYEKILFRRDLRWGIEHGYLCNILCKRVQIGYDLTGIRSQMGDYAPGELEKAMDGTADAVAQAYREHAVGATMIFAVSVHQCEEIARRIPGAVVVTGQTPDRAEIIRRFTNREIPCLVNCMVFTEGTDIPLIETVIIARPTQSDGLYTQMVGRGLRLHPEKEKLTLIDCVGVSGGASLCTAPTLLGLDLQNVPEKQRETLEGDLFELPEKIAFAADCPVSWIRNVEIVNLWAKEQKYDLHGVNWFRQPDGSLTLSLPNRKKLMIPAPDELGNVAEGVSMQEALDQCYANLLAHHGDEKSIWDSNAVKRWGKDPATEAQMKMIQRRCRNMEIPADLTKGQAAMILNRVCGGRKPKC